LGPNYEDQLDVCILLIRGVHGEWEIVGIGDLYGSGNDSWEWEGMLIIH